MVVCSGGRKLPKKVTFKGLQGRRRRRNGREMNPLVQIQLVWVELELERSASDLEYLARELGLCPEDTGEPPVVSGKGETKWI